MALDDDEEYELDNIPILGSHDGNAFEASMQAVRRNLQFLEDNLGTEAVNNLLDALRRHRS
jgi:hypothetical protein